MNCKTGNFGILEQITAALNGLSGEQYRMPLEVFNGSTIGQHFRHIFDFYHCLLRDLESGPVDYCNRERHPRIESEPVYAKEKFSELMTRIEGLQEEEAVKVRADFTANEMVPRPVVHSTVGRELMFAFDHAVHHLAIIKIGIQTAFPNVKLEENLGVAPSTLKHWSGHRAHEE